VECGPRPPIISPLCGRGKRLHCAMLVLVTGLCLSFSAADVEFDFVLMTSAYSQYLKESCKQCVFSTNQKLVRYTN